MLSSAYRFAETGLRNQKLRLLQNDGARQQQRVFEGGLAAAIRDGQMEHLIRADLGQRHVVHGPGDGRAADHVDRERARHPRSAADERLGDGHAGGLTAGHAERGCDRGAVDRERIVRAVLTLSKGGCGRYEESDGRSSEEPSEETHIPNNVVEGAIVAIRPMRRDDVDAFAAWGRHDDPLFRHYNVPALSRADADAMWQLLSADRARRPYAGLAGNRVVATLMVRHIDPAGASGELGIMLDPAFLGRGLGRRILRAFLAVLATDGFRRVHLEVAGYNERAIAAYRAAGFTNCGEHWADPEPGIDIASLLDGPAAEVVVANVRREAEDRYKARIVRMERPLTKTKDDSPL